MIALGHQGGDDTLEILLMGLRDAEEQHIPDVEYRGLVEGLAAHHSRRAFEVLLAMAPYGAHKRWGCRASATTALYKCAQWQEPHLQLHVVEQLRRFLRDQSEAVRKVSALGLVALHAEDAWTDLEGLKATFPLQEHTWIDRLKREAIHPQSNPDAEGKHQVQRLTSRVRELEEKLEKTLARVSAASGQVAMPGMYSGAEPHVQMGPTSGLQAGAQWSPAAGDNGRRDSPQSPIMQ